MEKRLRLYNRIIAVALFGLVPLLIYMQGSFPQRTVLKEVISMLTILSFFIMLLQFYLSRAFKSILQSHKMSSIVKWHKVLGYIFVSILLLHPFLMVIPRYFEAGVDPGDAFFRLIASINKQGILHGAIAWVIMLFIGITSLFRDRLPMSYKTWRIMHGIASIAFIETAALHVMNMGRHIDSTMMWLISLLTVVGIAALLKLYIFKSTPSNRQ